MTDRSLTAGFIAEITGGGAAPIALMKCYFDSGNLNLWTGIGDLTYNGDTYVGTGTILAIDKVKEQKKLVANGLNMTMTGLDQQIMDLVENEPYQGRSFELYIAMLDASGDIISDPYLWFEGSLDVMKTIDDGKSITVPVSIENVLVRLERALDTKYTSADQKREYANDTFYDFVPGIQNKEVVWG